MKRKYLYLAVALLAAANLGLANGAAADSSQDPDWGQCVCVDGSNPGGPHGPWTPDCWVLIDLNCSSASECGGCGATE